jgi:hypothetical protein
MVLGPSVWPWRSQPCRWLEAGLWPRRNLRRGQYAKDIAPIRQRSCQNCHRADGGRPCRGPPTKKYGRGLVHEAENRPGRGLA